MARIDMDGNHNHYPGDTSEDEISLISDESLDVAVTHSDKVPSVISDAASEDLSMSSCIRDSMCSVTLQDGAACLSTSSSAYFTDNHTSSTCSPISQCSPSLNGGDENSSTELVCWSGLPFRKSLFPNVPPTIEFCMPDAVGKVELHEDVRRAMLWQHTKTTPIIMKKILVSTGFRFTRKLNSWIGTWGRHMSAKEFNYFKSYQKVNHFPGTFQIGRKDKLWCNMKRMQKVHGEKHFDFVPLTFVLPNDTRKLWLQWDHKGNSQRWIVKPPASARGNGIQVIHKFGQLPKQGSCIVQKYLTKPYLINGSKFDLRLYVYVSSFKPLRVYLYEDGLVRFASMRYTNCVRFLGDHFVHLTNSSVNRASETYSVGDVNSFDGHKWTLRSLWKYLSQRGVVVAAVWSGIIRLVVKTIISCEPFVSLVSSANVPCRYNCHEVFGFDVMLDESLRPWLLEVNISPSLHSTTSLDAFVKGSMLRDLLNIAGFRMPPHLSKRAQLDLARTLGINESFVSHDDRLFDDTLSAEEKNKQDNFTYCSREKYVDDILENLTPNDVRLLIETEDELSRAGCFQRIFPTASSHSYHEFLATPRYHVNLLDAWEHKYAANRDLGRQRLVDACARKVHLKCETNGNAKRLNLDTIAARRSALVFHVSRQSHSSIRFRWYCRRSAYAVNSVHRLHRKRMMTSLVGRRDSGLSSSPSSCSSGDNSSVNC